MSAKREACSCKETAKSTSPGGALDASETAAKRAGVAEATFRGTPCNLTFRSYEDRYRYLRGKAACANPPVQFPCCTPTTLACSCEEPS